MHCTSTQCTKCGGFSSSLHIVLARVDFPDPVVPAEQSPFINSATHLKHFYEKENTKKFLIQYPIQVIGNTPFTTNKRAFKPFTAGTQQKHNIHHTAGQVV